MLLFVPIIGPVLALGTAIVALAAVGNTLPLDITLGPFSIINTISASGLAGVILMALAF